MMTEENTMLLPAVAMRGLVILPDNIVHFDISRKKSLAAVETAMLGDQTIFLSAQKDIEKEEPGEGDLYEIGTLAKIKQVLKMQNNIVRVLVEGKQRAKLLGMAAGDYIEAEVLPLETEEEGLVPAAKSAMLESLQETFLKYAAAHGKLPKEIIRHVGESRDIEGLIDYVGNNLQIPYEKKQELLEETGLEARYQLLLGQLFYETEVQLFKKDFQGKVKQKVDQHQKEYLLREQMGVIREELGETDTASDADEYLNQLEKLEASDEVKAHIRKEIKRFKNINGAAAESTVSRNYIETLLALPWDHKTVDNKDLARAREILDRDHYGLKDVKERVLDFLAVRNLTSAGESPIICLVGPPGTGKTSIARSIAEALEKKYVRVCLGGVHDEAEIRGHRRTYIGAMPGRIVDGLRQAGTGNPLMLLDEIDKVSGDYKGDASAALLEVLDGEQNHKFRDHYTEIPIDLSEVLFLATANDPQKIPRPLMDRMEVIEVSSYTENEKFHIAREHLLAKQLRANGIRAEQLSISDEALRSLIGGYTREAGVRNLERKLGEICRKAARSIYEGKTESIAVEPQNLEEFLGKEKYRREQPAQTAEAGLVRGLAWTSVGGVTLEVECAVMPGKGTLKLTGQMGDVMKESAQAGISCIRSLSQEYGIEANYFETHDIHIHIPEGATPKDGPSAGITMATAMLSAITGLPVRADVAMTGEITLRGRVLPIGGLKEKLLAAKNAGMNTVCIPKENERDLEEISDEIRGGLKILPVSAIRQVLEIALVK